MLMSQGINLARIGRQLCRVRLSGQDRSAQDFPALRPNKPNEVRERASLPDEVIHDKVGGAGRDRAGKESLIGEPLEPIRSSVSDGVELHDGFRDWQTEESREHIRQRHWNLVNALRLQCMGRDQLR